MRVQYAKRGRLRFTSHRDVSRAVERAVFRAQIPMAYSSGFHPHPRISYAGASPTGAASEAEYLELALAETCDVAEVGRRLDEALPDGLDVLKTADAAGGKLTELLQASRWWIDLAGAAGVEAAVTAFLAADSVEVERMTKKGLRSFDCRAAVAALAVVGTEGERVRLDLLLRHVTPAVRAGDVLTGLAGFGDLRYEGSPLLTRLAQGPYDEASGTIADPI